jgi:hypothetical protein
MSLEALVNGKVAEVAPSPQNALGGMEEFISSADPNIHDRLKALRLDEVITLAHSSLATHTVQEDGKSVYLEPGLTAPHVVFPHLFQTPFLARS